MKILYDKLILWFGLVFLVSPKAHSVYTSILAVEAAKILNCLNYDAILSKEEIIDSLELIGDVGDEFIITYTDDEANERIEKYIRRILPKEELTSEQEETLENIFAVFGKQDKVGRFKMMLLLDRAYFY